MPRHSIDASYKNALNKLSIVERFLLKSRNLPPDLQGFIGEVLMLRMFSILEDFVRTVACKIACGARYRNGSPSNPITLCKSMDDAMNKFKTVGRKTAKQNLHFTNVSNTNEAIKHVIGATEPFRAKLQRFGVEFDEMRVIRNHIAHSNNSTRKGYKMIIQRRYGASHRIKIGSFLVSTKRNPKAFIEQYLIDVRVIIKEISVG